MIFNPLFITNSSQASGAQASKFSSPNYLFADIINVNESGPAIGTTKVSDFMNSLMGVTDSSNNYVIATQNGGSGISLEGQGYKLNEKEITGVLTELIQNSDSISILNNNSVVTEFENTGDNFLGILQKIFSELNSNKNIQLQVKNGNTFFSVELLNLKQQSSPFNSLAGFGDSAATKLKNNSNTETDYPDTLKNPVKKILQSSAKLNKILEFINSDASALSAEFAGIIEKLTASSAGGNSENGTLTGEEILAYFEGKGTTKEEFIKDTLDNLGDEVLSQLFQIYSQDQKFITWTEQTAANTKVEKNLTAGKNAVPGNMQQLKQLMQKSGITYNDILPEINDFKEIFEETGKLEQMLKDPEILELVKGRIENLAKTAGIEAETLKNTVKTSGSVQNQQTEIDNPIKSQSTNKLGNFIDLSAAKTAESTEEIISDTGVAKGEKYLIKISQPNHAQLTNLITKGAGKVKHDDVLKTLLGKQNNQPENKTSGTTDTAEIKKVITNSNVYKELAEIGISGRNLKAELNSIQKSENNYSENIKVNSKPGVNVNSQPNAPAESIKPDPNNKELSEIKLFNQQARFGDNVNQKLSDNSKQNAVKKSDDMVKTDQSVTNSQETVKLNLAKTTNIYNFESNKVTDEKSQLTVQPHEIKAETKTHVQTETKDNLPDQKEILKAEESGNSKTGSNSNSNTSEGGKQSNTSQNSAFSNTNNTAKPISEAAQAFNTEMNSLHGNTNEIEKRIEVIKNVELNRINNELRNIVADKTSQNVTLKLTPATLGKVQITIEVIKDIVNARIEVENESVRQVVHSGLENLKQTLVQNGMILQNVNISLTNSEEKNQKFTKNKKNNNNDSKFELEQNPETETPKNMGYNTYDFVA